MYKYIVENWLTEETIKVFDSEEERQEWLNDNCISFSDGNYIDGTEIKISIYESRYNYWFKADHIGYTGRKNEDIKLWKKHKKFIKS